MKEYRHLILGGTFDHFHKGHELFLRTALEKTSSRLTIGLTLPALYASKELSQSIETYDRREKNIKKFVAKTKKNQTIKIIPISTIYGSSLTDVTVDGIVVTSETKRGAESINKKRKEVGMKPLDLISVPLVRAEDTRPISSFRIRYGDIDRNGTSYYEYFAGTQKLILPDELRPVLREPLGVLFEGSLSESKRIVKKIISTIGDFSPPMVFTIGDIIYAGLLESGYIPPVAVIDLKSRRKALQPKKTEYFSGKKFPKYRNRPGTIQLRPVREILRARDAYMKSGGSKIIIIQGEEDLLALPAILTAPLGSLVLYGLFEKGVVAVRVTEDIKKRVYALVRRFIPQRGVRD